VEERDFEPLPVPSTVMSWITAGEKHPADAYRQAWALLEASAPRKALEILDPAIEREPRSASLLTLRVWAYFQSAQLQKAEADLVGLVEDHPADVWARFALARVLERQARYAEALPHFRLAAVMSGDPEHETGVLRCERRIMETGGDLPPGSRPAG